MTVAPRPVLDPARLRRRNRFMLSAFAICAFVFLILPNLVIWWGSRDLCPSAITSKGTADGTAWEVLRNDCGKGGIIWQMRVIPDKGYSAVVMESRGGPEPVAWEQSGFEGTVVLSAPPKGEQSPRVTLKLDPKGQPIGQIDFKDGERQPGPEKS